MSIIPLNKIYRVQYLLYNQIRLFTSVKVKQYKSFSMTAPKIKLNNGREMPCFGLGTYKAGKRGEAQCAAQVAIDAGYRHFDCAYIYGNEAEIGEGIRSKIDDGTVTRDELFITSKLWCTYNDPEKVLKYCKQSVQNLGLGPLDLFLIHWPFAFKESNNSYSDVDYVDTWKAMEECVRQGLTHSIGISNFNSFQVNRILQNCTIKPVVNQVECNTSINQKKLTKFCNERDIAIVGYTPLGSIDTARSGVSISPVIKELCDKYKKTPAQIVLRYLIQLGVTPIPKSVTKSRIIENIQVFDFELSSEDTQKLDGLNTNKRFIAFESAENHKHYPFKLEF